MFLMSTFVCWLTCMWTADQAGQVSNSVLFDITRGVKQSDMLSLLLFNSRPGQAARVFKSKCPNSSLRVGPGECFNNIGYADDICCTLGQQRRGNADNCRAVQGAGETMPQPQCN